jgi:hypothetical protein
MSLNLFSTILVLLFSNNVLFKTLAKVFYDEHHFLMLFFWLSDCKTKAKKVANVFRNDFTLFSDNLVIFRFSQVINNFLTLSSILGLGSVAAT